MVGSSKLLSAARRGRLFVRIAPCRHVWLRRDSGAFRRAVLFMVLIYLMGFVDEAYSIWEVPLF